MTTENVLDELNNALIKFGTYSFDDKGVDEVMDISHIVKYVKTLSKEEAVDFIKRIIYAEGYKSRNEILAESTVRDCDDMPEEWFEYLLEKSGIEY